jgi:hypothetical protein
MNIKFWLDDPSIILKKNYISELWPNNTMTIERKLNAISRLILFLTVIGVLITKSFRLLISSLITLSVIVLLYRIKDNKKVETFKNNKPSVFIKDNFQEPTINNPLGNVLLTDIQDNPLKKNAAPSFNLNVNDKINEKTRDMIIDTSFEGDDKMKDKLFKDLGDSVNFENSMRNFNSTPNTRIANDQNAFANFLYGNMTSKKENNNIFNNPIN